MRDVVELLGNTTPVGVRGPDLEGVARRARRRRRVHRIAWALPVVALVVAGTVAFTAPSRGDGDLLVPAGPPIGGTTEGLVGRWTEVDPPPFSPRGEMFSFPTNDGRVLVWGGWAPDDGGREGGGTLTDGGIYDPAANAWEPIPSAPLPVGLSFHRAQLTGDRLAVLGSDAAGAFHGAIYDLATRAWTQIPAQDRIRVVVDAMGWTGDVLVVVRVDPGSDDETFGDWQIDTPLTLRWERGSGEWVEGASVPTGLRFGVAAGFDGERIALWGGTSRNAHERPIGPGVWASGDDQVFGDGAVYEVASDRWVVIPDAPVTPSIHAALSWHEGWLLAGGGFVPAQENAQSPDLAGYDPSSGTWTELPAAPAGGPAEARLSARRYASAYERVLTVERDQHPGGLEPGWYFDGSSWRQAPLEDIHAAGGRVVATTNGVDPEPGAAFGVQVSRDGGPWFPAVEAPFTNRGGPAVVLVRDWLVVVGGFERTTYEPVGSAWVLDLNG